MTKQTWEDGMPVETHVCSVCKTDLFVRFLTRDGKPACEVCSAESNNVDLGLPDLKEGPERFEFAP